MSKLIDNSNNLVPSRIKENQKKNQKKLERILSLPLTPEELKEKERLIKETEKLEKETEKIRKRMERKHPQGLFGVK